MARRLFINQINIPLLNRGAIRILLDYSFLEWITQSTNGINLPLMNSSVRQRWERLVGLDYNKVQGTIATRHLRKETCNKYDILSHFQVEISSLS